MSSFISEYLQNHKLYKLLYRIANHDPEALEILFHDYGSFIYWHIMNYVQDKSLGEDIFSGSFYQIISIESSKCTESWCNQLADSCHS